MVFKAMPRNSTYVLGDLQAPVTAAQLAELDAALPDARLQVRPPNLDDLFLQLAEGSDA